MHRKTRRALHDPRLLWIASLQHRCLQSLLPLSLLGRSAQQDAGSAIGAVRFQDQELAVLPRIFQQVPFPVVRKCRAAIGDHARPQDVTAEQPAVVGPEILLGNHRVGQDLKAALVIEIANDRGDDAVLPEQKPHGIERAADLLFERHQLAHLVVAISDVDANVLVEDLLALDAQFTRVGMSDGQIVPVRQIIAQHRLLVGTVMDVFCLDETELA